MIYSIFLDNNKIGISLLEKADVPMGCVFGQIIFVNEGFTYGFFSKYCKDNGIVAKEYPEDKLITTQTIQALKVLNENGAEINGEGSYIEGMDSDVYQITIIGIPYPFFEDEFPHHVAAYREKFP